MQDRELSIYVVDTHALFWYFEYPHLLSPAADAVFRLATAGGAQVVVPAIVIAEFYHLSQKAGPIISPSLLLAQIDVSREFIFSELGRAQLERMEEVTEVLEMHDRLIAAEALVYRAPIISRGQALRASGVVDVIW